uniref:uncharacterized protein isoform X1 n=2 Tax=Semicossyphus pulcher TaxID=241346 RepID=UPI0037E82914
MHHSLIMTKWGWTQFMILYLMVSGRRSLVTVHQPPVLTSALGHAVMLPCELILPPDEKLLNPPVLYWDHLKGDDARLWPRSEKYKNRVNLTDNNPNSLNKSILLKNAQWADSGKYLCKLSIVTRGEKSRKFGNKTLLMVYDTMSFKLTNDSLLSCEVNVTQDPSLVLSIFHDGSKLPTVCSARQDAAAALPYASLSESVSVRSGGKYECRLHLNAYLITKRSFNYDPPEPDKGRDAERNVTVTSSTTVPGAAMLVFPEPWVLYSGLLLVPITILLGIITVQLTCRH